MKELKRITLINTDNPNHTVSLPTHVFEIEHTDTELILTSPKLWAIYAHTVEPPVKVTTHDHSSIDIMKALTETDYSRHDAPFDTEFTGKIELYKQEGRECDQ